MNDQDRVAAYLREHRGERLRFDEVAAAVDLSNQGASIALSGLLRDGALAGLTRPGRGTYLWEPPAEPTLARREAVRPEEAVGFMALGATERVMELLRGETTHRTIAGLARSAQVSRATAAKLIRRLERERKLDVDRRTWPNGYLLKPEARR